MLKIILEYDYLLDMEGNPLQKYVGDLTIENLETLKEMIILIEEASKHVIDSKLVFKNE